MDNEMRSTYRLMFGEERSRTGTVVRNRNRRLLTAAAWEPVEERLTDKKSLLSALRFEDIRRLPRIVSLVGGGGKTSTMYQLADELSELYSRVLVTTSTHIRKPADNAAEVSHVREIEASMWGDKKILTAGTPVEKIGGGKPGSPVIKFRMPEGLGDEKELERLLGLADVILIEADGAKEHPLKVPAEWEPVILPQTGLVIACAGLKAVGEKFSDVCFRFDDCGAWLGRGGKERVAPEDVARLLADERGFYRQVGERHYRIVLNQADGERERRQAVEIARLLPDKMQKGCAVTAYQR